MFHRTYLVLVVAIAGAGVVRRRSTSFIPRVDTKLKAIVSLLDYVSKTCKDTLMTMLSDPDLDCFNTKPILAVISSPNQTLPQISEEWLKGLCSTGSCSNAAISKTVTALIGGCVNDLKELTSVPDTSKLVDYFQKSYSTFREAACLKDDKADRLCFPLGLSTLQAVVGPPLDKEDLEMKNFQVDANNILGSDIRVLACTACTKALYGIGLKIFPFPQDIPAMNKRASNLCGASFFDGNIVNVSETAIKGEFRSNPSSISTNSTGVKPGSGALGPKQGFMSVIAVAVTSFAAFSLV